ncbi:MAG: sulfite exporter TauE/SafE family protein [Gemmatimonadetes bacterium]|nr:sulfite exporter TauE/SafE family protein [Gemmatimonadota bacterium]
MTIEPYWVPVLFVLGIVAGFLNTVAGGGSFFTFPFLIFLGYPPHLANGTIRVTIVMQNLVGVPTFARSGHFYPRETLIAALAAIPAALLGALVAVHLSPDRFRVISAVLVIVVLVTLFVRPSDWMRTERLPRIRWHLALPLFAAVGFYGGFFQLGAGMPFLVAAVLGGGWDLVSANSVKVSVILLFSLVALFVFADSGHVDWIAGVTIGVGNMLGAWLGARSAVKRGPGWIRWIMVVMAVLAAVRLLVG